MSRTTLSRTHFSRFALAALLALPALPAAAHVELEKAEATPGATFKAVLKVGHGCDGSPTTALRVSLPDELAAITPLPKTGWTAAFETETIGDKPARVLVWRGGPLPDASKESFAFLTDIPAPLAGRAFLLPVVQQCVAGEKRWTEPASASGKEAANPAPLLKVAAGPVAEQTLVLRAGDLVIDTPWSRATPGGAKVGGGYLRITNTGAAPDRLVGASFAVAGRTEVHEMAVRDGVMTMRPLNDGVVIPAGGSVEFAPGGYHLMLLDLKAPITAGTPLSGTLTFEKAGKVEVPFQVRAVGAPAPGATSAPAGGGHDHGNHGAAPSQPEGHKH